MTHLRDRARELDARDPLAGWRDTFDLPEPPLLYFDGNSLGIPPRAAAEAVAAELERWRSRLIRGWNERWLTLVEEASAALATVVGAGPGTVRVADSTSVCLSKLARAALRARPGRPDVVSDRGNFPTDLYVLDAAARSAGGALRLLEPAPDPGTIAAALDDRVGLASFSHVDFRTGELLDLPAITAVIQETGALVLWDLSHSAGVVPVNLDEHGVDLAVGCTYKYLNGGPGAPGFLYVRDDLIAKLESPIPGWFGHAEPFAMETVYRPAAGIDRFLAGTPPILSLASMLAGVELVAEAGVEAIREKSVALTTLAIDLADAWLAPLGFTVATPRGPDRRGGQVALRHPDARQITALLVSDCHVIPDFREPDIVRIGLSPLTTRFADVVDGFDRLAAGVREGRHTSFSADLGRVT